ncbi:MULTISPECIES: AraC family transcriptional regulator [Lactiplantibacillus]|nr:MULTISPECIES: GyrI-like domain-containing protein [Lactiplantibacillus]ETY72524.1 DNA gyrase inhibitor [Lactiplantibacillus fabifermentans T30PCM01]
MKIESFDSAIFAYMQRIGPYGPVNRQLMQTFKAWLTRENLGGQAAILALACDNPATTPAAQCRYEVGIVVPSNLTFKAPIAQRELVGGRYVIFEIEHTASAIGQFYQQLTTTEPTSQWHRRPAPIIERYQPDLVNRGRCEILVPIK